MCVGWGRQVRYACYFHFYQKANRIYRHVLTGSYHNYFRIYDTDTLNDVVLQADKSHFKAKGRPLQGGKAGAKNGARPGGLKDAMQLETLDFNKKILHASWHPRENTIAVSHTWVAFSTVMLTVLKRLPRRTICSCTVRHNLLDTPFVTHCRYRSTSHRNVPSHPPSTLTTDRQDRLLAPLFIPSLSLFVATHLIIFT